MSRKVYDWQTELPPEEVVKAKLDKYGLPHLLLNPRWIPAVWSIIHDCEEMSLYPSYEDERIVIRCKQYDEPQGGCEVNTRKLNKLATRMDNWSDLVLAVSNNGTIYNNFDV